MDYSGNQCIFSAEKLSTYLLIADEVTDDWQTTIIWKLETCHYNLLHLSNYFNFLDYLLIQWLQKLRQTAFSKATQFGVDASFTSIMSQLLIKWEKTLNAFYLSTLLGRRNCGRGSKSPPSKMYGWNSDHRKLLFGPHREGKQVS